MNNFLKVEAEAAFVLHQKNFQNTSKIIELFTRNFGRVSVIAKGVKRSKSSISGVLRPFVPILVNFQGKSELKTLTNAETNANNINLHGLSLYCGFYINELILHSIKNQEPHPVTFQSYHKTLLNLELHHNINFNLRQFEYSLLNDLGLGFDVKFDKFNQKVLPNKSYVFASGLEQSNAVNAITGECLQTLITQRQVNAKCLKKLKQLLQNQLDLILHGYKLKSKDLLNDYLKLQDE